MDSKPTTITAQEFIDGGYEVKIKAGECKVTNSMGYAILARLPDAWGHYVLDHEFNGKLFGGKLYSSDDRLTVIWLPQPQASEPSPATAAGEFATVEGLTMLTREDGSKSFYRPHRGYVEVFYDTLDTVRPLQAERDALRADNARLQAELAAARVENELRGEFLGRVVDIRQRLIDQRSNSWLDSIDAIELELTRLESQVSEIDGLLTVANAALESAGEPTTDDIVLDKFTALVEEMYFEGYEGEYTAINLQVMSSKATPMLDQGDEVIVTITRKPKSTAVNTEPKS